MRNLNMDRERPESGWRAAAFAAALFAITLNFLQPLAHAVLLRDGGNAAAAALWGAFCQAAETTEDGQAPLPAAVRLHDCCIGLAHAPVLAAPSSAFVVIEPVATAIRFVAEIEALTPVGIRDGPAQPRGPPSHA